VADDWVPVGATTRCLTHDLGFNDADRERPIEDLAELDGTGLLKALLERRSLQPEGVDRIDGLQAKINAYSLHSGRHRGLTWHDRRNGVVWLLAARFHTSGAPDDAYPHFRALKFEELLPTGRDFQALELSRVVSFAGALLEAVPILRRQALDAPGGEIRGSIGGIGVRLVANAESYPPILHLAVSLRLPPYAIVPPEWLGALIGTFYKHIDPDGLLPFDSLFPGAPLEGHEVAFADYVPDR
jgi:hypothetical protein